jgi:hypothetical protein
MFHLPPDKFRRARLKTFLVAARRKSPHPNAQKHGDDESYPANRHRYFVSCDHDFRVFEKSRHVAKSKKRKNYARDA